MNWIDTFTKAIEQAMTDGLVEFVMQYQGRYYYCYWNKNKWDNRLIEFVTTESGGENENNKK